MNTQDIVFTEDEKKTEDAFYNAYIEGKIKPVFVNFKKKSKQEIQFQQEFSISVPATQKVFFFSLAKQKNLSPEELFADMLKKYQTA